jgi:thiol-disulfide isomerase/thioredoxin
MHLISSLAPTILPTFYLVLVIIKAFYDWRPEMLQLLLALTSLSLGGALGEIRVRDWADDTYTLAELSTQGAIPDTAIPDTAIPDTVVVNVWATWCPPCREELPWLLDYHEAGRIALLAVNLGDAHGAVARFLADEGLELLPVYFASHRELQALRLPGLPTSYVVRKGELAGVHYGPLSPDDLARLLEEE